MHTIIKIPSDKKIAYCVKSPGYKGKPLYDASERPVFFNLGKPISGEVPPLSVTTDDEHGSLFLDVLPNQGSNLIVSKIFLDILISLELKNVETYPLTVKDFASKNTRDYWICNVTGLIPCLDRERSDVSWDEDDPGKAFLLRKAVIDESSIESFNERDGGRLRLFRLAESRKFLIASDDVREAVLTAGITGIEFRKSGEAGDFL